MMRFTEKEFEQEFRTMLLHDLLVTLTPHDLAVMILGGGNRVVNTFINPYGTEYDNDILALTRFNVVLSMFGQSCNSIEEYLAPHREAFIEQHGFIKETTTGTTSSTISWYTEKYDEQ